MLGIINKHIDDTNILPLVFGVVLLICVPILYMMDFPDLIPLALISGIFSIITAIDPRFFGFPLAGGVLLYVVIQKVAGVEIGMLGLVFTVITTSLIYYAVRRRAQRK